MAKVKLNLRSKTDAELIVFGEAHNSATTGNANFPTPLPDGPTFVAATAAFKAAVDAQEIAQNSAKEATSAKEAARTVYVEVFNQRRNYVENESGGDEPIILSSGFGVRSTGSTVGNLPAPIDFLATMGDMPGEIDLTWSPVKGKNVYMIQCKQHEGTASWESMPPSTGSKATIPDLETGKEYTFRVAALGAAGQGPWSDESIKMAP